MKDQAFSKRGGKSSSMRFEKNLLNSFTYFFPLDYLLSILFCTSIIEKQLEKEENLIKDWVGFFPSWTLNKGEVLCSAKLGHQRLLVLQVLPFN